MASNFLKQKAASSGQSGASSFLRNQAQAAREKVDAEYGPDAYGGSNYDFEEARKRLLADRSAVGWAKSSLLSDYDERDEKYDGFLGGVRGAVDAAVAGIKSGYQNIGAYITENSPVYSNGGPSDNSVQLARDMAAAAREGNDALLDELTEQAREQSLEPYRARDERAAELAAKADKNALEQELIREAAVGDKGFIPQLLFDTGVAGTQLLTDVAANVIAPGAGLVNMFARATGNSIGEARRAGADGTQQLLYGLGAGAVEMLTEKIANVAKPLANVFGKGAADDIIENVINRLASSTNGQAALRILASSAGEGLEEAVSTLVNPALQRIYDENALQQYSKENMGQLAGDALYDALVGAALGGVAQLPGTVSTIRRGGDVATPPAEQTAANSQAAENQALTTPSNQSDTQAGVDASAGVSSTVEAPVASQTAPSVETLLSSGSVSNNVAERIINTPELRAQFEALTGQRLTGTKSEMRSAIKEFAQQRAEDAAVEQFESDVAEMNGEGVTQTPQAANMSEIPNSSPVQNVNPPVMPDSSAVSPTDSLGAAPAGFDRFSAALNQYGEMPERGTGAREMSIPNAMNDSTVVPRTVQTFANAEATPETTYTDITRILEEGGFNRAVITDRASLGRAEQTITDKGFQQALIDWTATVRSGRVSKDTTTLGLALYNNAINSGDTQTGIQILTDIVDNARTAAQATQAVSILNKLTPEGRLYGVQRSIANLQDELNTKYGDLAPNLHIDDSLAGDYLNATDEQTRFEILEQIYQDIANQIPQNWYDKLNAWRYFAMLANPRTHVRNVLGNSAMAGLTSIRNRISSGLQRRFVSDRSQRTRETISRRNSAEDAARYQVGLQEYKRINDMLGDAGKYTNELNRIRRHMRAPFNGVLGKAVDFASNTLEAEDIFFSQKAYASNLAQFLRARGITAEDYVSGNAGQEVIAEAQAYAIREAQRLTFRDFNTFSNFVQRIANLGGDSAAGRVWQTIVGANIPFTRTPANIVVRGVEYSPIGLMRGLFNLGVNVKRGNMTAGEAIDQISSGLVGTALVGLGALLASQGVITGGGSDDEEQAAFDELRGFQPYALQIGGNSYTLDWLAPAALPFFTGAEIWNQLAGSGSEDEETNALEAVLQGIGHMTDPMLEMSMLSGISDLLDSVAYYQGSNSLWPVLSSSVTNYISQFFPSVFGAIERTIEDTRQSSYTDPTSIIPDDLQYPISQAMNRLPGEYNQVDYIDAWGRTESTGNLAGRAASNFVSPGYYSRLSESEVEDELQRVYDATGGEYNVFPDRATMGNTTINGERLTPEQYTEYATTLGQTRLAEVSALMETDAYKAMSDTEKARAIQEVYDYALQTAKHAIDPSYEVDSRYEKAAEYGDIAEYLAFDRAWNSVEDSKGADTAAFEAVMEDYANMDVSEQNALMEMLGENTRFDDVVEAFEAGISPEQWYTAYDEYKALSDDSGLNANGRATEFAKWLDTESKFTEQQQSLLEEQLGFFTQLRANSDRYDALIDAGFAPAKADAVYDAVSALEPEQGKTQVSNQQKYEAIVGTSGLTDDELVAALTEYEGAGSEKKQKFKTAYAYGISPEEYVAFLGLKEDGVGDADGNGSYKADETTALVNAFLEMYPDASRADAALLWAMTNKSKSGNPFANFNQEMIEWDIAP